MWMQCEHRKRETEEGCFKLQALQASLVFCSNITIAAASGAYISTRRARELNSISSVAHLRCFEAP